MSASSPSAWEGVVAGGVAGGLTRLIAAPLDLLKIRFQVQVGAKHYKNLAHAVACIYREEGMRTFWRGNIAATMLWVSYSGVQFGCYQALQNAIDKDDSKLNWVWYSASGAIAGVAATVATYPFDHCRTVMSSQGVPKVYPNMRRFFEMSIQQDGIARGLYKGLGPTVYQIIPYMGLSFGIYSTLNHLSSSASPSRLQWLLHTVGNGAIAGFTSKLLVYPMDTVKKRMQMQGVPRHADYGQVIPVYKNSWHCARDILHHEGIHGLYKGTVPSLIKSMLAHSCTFTVYELTVRGIHQLKFVTQIA
ncbi:hypothetical protein LEN26_014293 [Aphanomyces euteiches]|nr:hypothetical protein LEN26_014293 [Aphanomyces euteiches]KAH9112435.1 hypothetical protein AeMF1_013233 [Aphanomyces euteiches]KAH9191183.1 hypothetical protein AeNC1_006838 [Aphanomyces euteiches]